MTADRSVATSEDALRLRPAHALLGLLLACTGGSDSAALPAPVSVMPLGDSLTSGYRVPGGYRPLVYDGLVDHGWSIDFVGSLSGPSDMIDPDHQGHNTYLINELLPVTAEKVPFYDPDIVLLLIGTNDIVSQEALDEAPARLGELLELLTDREVLVGTLPPVLNAPAEANIQAYNASLITEVEAAGHAVVDLHAAMTDEMLLDAIHPNEEGYAAMADAWLAALTDVP